MMVPQMTCQEVAAMLHRYDGPVKEVKAGEIREDKKCYFTQLIPSPAHMH